MHRDLYEILGVAPQATTAELKEAYRRRVRDEHPDKHNQAPAQVERFKALTEAYETLSDPSRRAHYDRSRPQPKAPARKRGRGIRGEDLRYQLAVSFKDAVLGADREVRVPSERTCQVCGGTGAALGSTPTVCQTCHGEGQLSAGLGLLGQKKLCTGCKGRGAIISDPCLRCHGRGQQPSEKRITLKIPPGIESGTRLKLENEGRPGRFGGPAGDLFVIVEVEPDAFWSRQGRDLHLRLPVPYTEAMLGLAQRIKTLNGPDLTLKIPPLAENGRVYRVSGRGLDGRPMGDLLVTLDIVIPEKLSPEEQEHVLALRRLGSAEDHPRIQKFREAADSSDPR